VNFKTYASGGVLLCALIGALTNQHYSWCAVGVAVLGAWLPHLCEHPWLTCRLGSKTATHSLLGMAVCAFLTSPLLLCHQTVFWTTLLIGYLAHLLLDAGSDRGVLLFYPSRVRAVIPRHPLSRVIPGSPREIFLRRWLVAFLIIALPLNAIGLRGLLHQILPVVQFAVEDNGIYSAQSHRVFIDFTGRFTASQRPIIGRWEVLETLDRTTLLAEDAQGQRYTLGTHPHDTIQVQRIRARKGPLLDMKLQTIHLHEQLLGDIVPLIPSDGPPRSGRGRTYLIGMVKTPETLQPHITVEQFQPVQASHGQVELRYATPHDLEDPHLLGLYVTEGEIVLRTLKDRDSHSVSGGTNPPSLRVAPNRTITLVVHHFAGSQELLVREGQTVHAGQPLIDLRTYRTKLLADLRVAQAQVVASKALVLSLQLKQAQDRSLKRIEDSLIGSYRDMTVWNASENQILDHAQVQLISARAKLSHLKQELATTTLRAPASGRFLTMQFHPTSSTATLYLYADD